MIQEAVLYKISKIQLSLFFFRVCLYVSPNALGVTTLDISMRVDLSIPHMFQNRYNIESQLFQFILFEQC